MCHQVPSRQHEMGKAAESSVCLEQHFDAFVPAQISDEHDRPIGMGRGLVKDEVIGNEVWG